MTERLGEAFEADELLTVLGETLQPGESATDFELDILGAEGTMHSVRLGDTAGSGRRISVINSVDTPVCLIETQGWEDLRQDLPDQVSVFTVSRDLPFALARGQDQHGAGHQLLSAHRDEAVGRSNRILIKERRMPQRAVFVIDARDNVVYAEYVSDQMAEPNYQAAIEAVRRAEKG